MWIEFFDIFCFLYSPKGRKLRKLPSREDLERSPSSPNSIRNTSTPRLKALGDRLTVSIFAAEDERPYSGYDSLVDDQEKKLQARSLLGLSAESRRKSSEYKFKCPTCKKQFKYLSNLKSHLSIVHKNLYSASESKPLRPSNHSSEQAIQGRAKEYQCEVCLKKFKYASNMKTHRKVHSTLDWDFPK